MINGEITIEKENKTLTFGDLFKSLKPSESIPIPFYDVNIVNGEITVIEKGRMKFVPIGAWSKNYVVLTHLAYEYRALPNYNISPEEFKNTSVPGYIRPSHILFINKEEAQLYALQVLEKQFKQMIGRVKKIIKL